MEYRQISMMTYTLARGEWNKTRDIVKLCEFTRELGLEAIDWITTYDSTPGEVRKICDDFGLKTICYTFFADLNFPDKNSRQPGLDKVKEGIEAASILGTDKIMLPIPGKEGLTREESRRNVIEGLKDAVETGEKQNITVTVEHFPHKTAPFIVSSDVNEAIKEVPKLRVTYDNGNVMTGGEDPVEGFLKSKEYIVHSHFKDFRLAAPEEAKLEGADGRHYRGALVGEGELDYPAIVKAMNRSGYKGYINFEYEGSTYTPEESMRKGLRYLEQLFETAG